MGAAVSNEESAVVLSGLDGAGKSALLRTARRGQTLPTVERNGVVYEVLTLEEGASAGLLVCDVTDAGGTGAWRFLQALEAVNGSGDSNALVHVIRASDQRAVSSLWELYSIVKSFRCAHMPVCVVIVSDHPHASAALTSLAAREALPPGASAHWPPDFRFEDLPAHPDPLREHQQDRARLDAELLKSPIRGVNETGVRSRSAAPEPWLSESHLGEDEHRAASHADGAPPTGLAGGAAHDGAAISRRWEADYRYVAEQCETQSHGFGVALDASDSPPLSALHSGPWLVLQMHSLEDAAAALAPFSWISSMLKRGVDGGDAQAEDVAP